MDHIRLVRRDANGLAVASAVIGSSIEDAAGEAVALAKTETAGIKLEFNGVYLDVNDQMTPDVVARSYRDFMQAYRDREDRNS